MVPGLVALAALLVLLGLGTWQIERKAWKGALIATLDRRLNDAPIALPPSTEWAGMTPDNSEFTRVRVRLEFLKDSDALVYSSGSALRDDAKGTGYFVFFGYSACIGIFAIVLALAVLWRQNAVQIPAVEPESESRS